MTEQELLHAVKTSAQDVEVPEHLTPEEMRKKIQQQKRPVPSWKWLSAAAAILVLTVGIVGLTSVDWTGRDSSGQAEEGAQSSGILAKDDGSGTQKAVSTEAGTSEGAAGILAEEADVSIAAVSEPKRDAGDMFTVAENYEQVYAIFEKTQEYSFTRGNGGLAEASVAKDDAATVENSISAPIMKAASMDSFSDGNMKGYSKTNLQTAGVDESDIIKTDGSYLYTVRQEGIVITDISGDAMANVATIRLKDAGARVMEMYVQGDVLNLIVQQADSGLERQEKESSMLEDEVYIMDTTSSTHLLTYDISERKHPILAGEVSQDGAYYTSRKIGSVVYLFTTEYEMTDIPRIGGCRVEYDCIYLPERGRQGLLVSSVDVKEPDEVLDHVMVINDYVEIYVSTRAMYLYQYSWQDQNPVTQIAKFTLDKGAIQAVGSTNVKGMIRDTFAINENGGQLRVLTTDWGGAEDTNNLYVLDDELKLTGSLQGLAAGEQIYAARFLGNMAYFVTYRNTDPLFAVDLSNPAEPKVLSELKITGFSEYLHFWGRDKLLGIGYETDPETGRQQGIKLSMFDISDPSELKVLDSVVLEGLDYSPALYEYKTVLADSSANLFGFVGVDYGESGKKSNYYLYQWEEEGFSRLLKAELDLEAGESEYRGLYSGAKFYLANPVGVTSYDRENGYEKIESLKY